ncbi:hypothetical protein DSO57_1025613 [Entomophthora muscae]|uniref:Uncharacterized protein n=1 Tax=Entomophthora muscae TaxID=34485 RepID=A0ACC2SRC9_9FUNG|nr:hypothetical protein DSO57_1025613 [Entomophthora muscae]
MSANFSILKECICYITVSSKLYRSMDHKLMRVLQLVGRQLILSEVHNSFGHFGVIATAERLQEKYWWPKYFEGVKNM